MYRKCVTDISIQHQRQAEAALLELMQQQPFADITVTSLCRKAGITRRVFYHLFSNKQAVLYALVDHKILDMGSYGGDTDNETLQFFLYWKAQKEFLDALAANGMSGLLLERMIDQVLTEDYDVLYWLRNNGWSTNSKEVVVFGLSGLVGLVYSWYHSGYQQTPEEMTALVEQMVRPYLK